MKNKLTDLNNHLFAQLERISEEGLEEEDLKREIARSKAVAGVAAQITETARLRIDAAKLRVQHGATVSGLLPDEPPMIEHTPADSKTVTQTEARLAGPEHRVKPAGPEQNGVHVFQRSTSKRAPQGR